MGKDLKAFLLRGNVVDLAVAVVLGAAFTAIVTSLVADVVTPLLLRPAMVALRVERLESLQWNGVLYGRFLAVVLAFVLTALVMFALVRALQALRRADAMAPPPTKDQALLAEIRDLLRRQERRDAVSALPPPAPAAAVGSSPALGE
jgi:large conductance mechanosensitive channel